MARRSALIALCLVGLACGSSSSATVAAPKGLRHWTAFTRAPSPIDVALGRSDGRPVIAANGRLYLLTGRALRAFAPAYRSNPGLEAYITLPAPRHRGCSFGRNTVYAIRFQDGRGVSRVTPSGVVSRFAGISAPGLINGITFDELGRFHHRLLVSINHGTTTTVVAVSCRGAVTKITSSAPRVEGGIAVAPRSFGRFGGDLIAPDELSGRIFAITPAGRSMLVANSGLPHGQDLGVESETFVPTDPHARFLVADRLTPRNPHPGDNVLLGLTAAALRAEGVAPGDLLVTGEGGAFTDTIRCGPAGCRVRYIADGPPGAHIEGHIGVIAG